MPKNILQSELAADVLARHAQVTDDVEASLRGWSEEQLNWKPAPKSWSAGECLRHLIVTHDAYWPNVQPRIGSTAARATEGGRVTSTWFGGMLLGYVEPGRKKKVKAPGVFAPARSNVPGDVLDAFLRCHATLGTTIENTQDLDWHRVRVATPVSRLIRLRLGDVYNILVTHAQRHVNQAKALKGRDGFPA